MNTLKQLKEIPGVKYKAVLSNRIYLTRTDELHTNLIQDLSYTLPPKRYGGFPETYCDVSRINQNILTIPIGRTDLIPEFYEIEDKRTLVPVNFPEFKFELRPSQAEVVDEVDDNCLINANPSYGKTFSAIAIAAKLGQKTLVVVHTKKLFLQWIKEVEKTLGIKAGAIGDGRYNIQPDIVIGMSQSLKKRMHELSSVFGLLAVDETHHLPATVFKNIVDSSRARYKIGLSATMWRKDGKHVLLKDYMGTKVFQPIDENKVEAEILIINTNIPFSSDSNKYWAARVNELMQNEEYMELVVNLSHAQVERGHKVLTVGDRIEFLETCGAILEEFQVIAGDSSNDEIDLVNNDGIFGTGKIFSEGINLPPLSCLIMAYPINNRALLKQLIGRIERPCEGKKSPQAIDIALTGSTAKRQLAQRINFYVNEGYKIKYL